jgi:class 3 adenylate cyclase
VFLLSANAETQTKSFVEWAGGVRVMLAIVFTDVVGATAKGQALGDEQMMAIKREHFALGSKLIGDFNGREIKTIGDSFLAAFHDAGEALDFALALQKQAGVHDLKIRAGIHIGPLHVERNDVFGGTVDFAARVVGAAKEAEIWLSSRAKEDIEALRATRHSHLQWQCHEGTVMKGFAGTFNLWSLVR